MRSALLALALVAAPLSALAQAPTAPSGAVSGRLIDAATRAPLDAATVSLWRTQDSTLVTGTLADDAGRFAFTGLMPGRYFLRLSLIGYRSERVADVTLTPAAPVRALGDLALQPEDVQGSEVTVAGEREAVQVGIDRTTYNVAGQAVTAGRTAADVLRTVPAVELDAEGNVSLRGSQNVAILINGRPTPIPRQFLGAYLQQLPAGSIDKVEVIPNPSARYEPDGMAGMLNIVLKQNTDPGFAGTVQAGGDTNGGATASVNLSYGKGPWTTNATYGLRRDARAYEGLNEQDNRTTLAYFDTADEGAFSALSHSLTGAADYRLSPRQTVGVQLTGALSDAVRDATADYAEGTGTASLRTFSRTSDLEAAGRTGDAALTYRYTVTPGQHELTSEVRYAAARSTDAGRYTSTLVSGQPFAPGGTSFQESERFRTVRDDVTAQLDYTRPAAGFKIEAGGKLTSRGLGLTETRTRPATGQTVIDYTYDEQVYAAYLTAGRTVGKWAAQAGVRAEQALATLEQPALAPVEKDYFRFYPSAFLAYTLRPGHTLRASYSQRVARPDPRQLNPAATAENPRFVRRGNPDLDPEFTHAYELSYSGLLPVGMVQLTPYFRRTDNAVGFAMETDAATGVTTMTFRNLARRDTYGADLTLGARLPNKFQAGATASVFRIVSEGALSNGEAIGLDALTWTLRLNGSYTLRPGTDLSGFLSYNPAQKTEQGRMDARGFSSIALRQSLLRNKASLTLNVFDPLGIMRFSGETVQGSMVTAFERVPRMRSAGLTFSYSFGQTPAPARRPQRQQEQAPGNDPMGGF